MMDSELVLAILTDQIGAKKVLRHAACAAESLRHHTIAALHVRVDPLSTILPTEEVMSEAQERALKEEGEQEAAAIFAVFEAWRGKDNENAKWEDVFGTIEAQVRQHAADARLLVIAAPRSESRGHARQAFTRRCSRPGAQYLRSARGLRPAPSVALSSVGRTTTLVAGFCWRRRPGSTWRRKSMLCMSAKMLKNLNRPRSCSPISASPRRRA
jgi:hypothetical protein